MSVHIGQLCLDERDPRTRQTPVSFKLRLTGTAQTDAADRLPFQVRPHPRQPWQSILQLRQFNLQTAFVRHRSPRKDVKDQCRPVEHLHVQACLDVPELGRREFVIENDDIHLEFLD
jgi:hypothetical protein